MKKKLLNFIKITLALYLFLCGVLYFFQEKLIFFPEELNSNYQFNFHQDFKEMNLEMADGKQLNGLLFSAENSCGLIFYLHGNSGSLSVWGNIAATYTALNYDIFILDYRGFGKSEGSIASQVQLFSDNQSVYNELKNQYQEENIIILGYSIGTGMAAYLASTNQPQQLILQAPYYSLTDLMRERFPLIPRFILKYKLATHHYLSQCKMLITVFHGDQDAVIKYASAVRLKRDFPSIDLIRLAGQGHHGMADNEQYKIELKRILEN